MEPILIAFATKTGVTRDAALRLAAKLAPQPCDLYDCRRQTFVPNPASPNATPARLRLTRYGTAVLGSAMYMGQPLPALTRFCRRNLLPLTEKRLVLFTCGVGSEAEDREYLCKHLPAAITQRALACRHMGGEVRAQRLGWFGRMAMRTYAQQHGQPEGLNDEALTALATLARQTNDTEGENGYEC